MTSRRCLPPVLAWFPLIVLTACNPTGGGSAGRDGGAETPGEPRSFAQRPSPAQRLDEAGVSEAFMVEAPETGVDLGWGWSVDREQVIPTECVEFVRLSDPSQETTVSISEVRDSQSLSSAMDISAAVSVKTIGYSASGKAKFAKNTKITAFSTTYVVRAEVRNGAEYAAPGEAAPGHAGAAIVLTDGALALAKRDIETFQGTCGEGFVSARMTGAEAYAVIDIQTHSKSERESVTTSVKGSGWGVKVDAAFNATTQSGQEKANTNISFYQAGGSGKPLPKDKVEIETRIKNLSQDALDAPKTYALQITPYQVLENFPRGAELTADAGEVDEIAGAWGLHRTVYDEIGTVFADPAAFTMPAADCTDAATAADCSLAFVAIDGSAIDLDGDGAADVEGVTGLDLLGVYQDVALLALDRIELGARQCLEADEACEFDLTALRSAYAVRAGLPMPDGWLGNDDGNADVLKAAHTAFHLRDAAREQCVQSTLTPGCVSNADIAGWAARTGFVPVAAESEVAFGRAKAVLDGNAPYLTGDPDRPDALILWVPPANLRAVQAALAGTVGAAG